MSLGVVVETRVGATVGWVRIWLQACDIFFRPGDGMVVGKEVGTVIGVLVGTRVGAIVGWVWIWVDIQV